LLSYCFCRVPFYRFTVPSFFAVFFFPCHRAHGKGLGARQ
jgi:hypothetical protein